jgi:tRNA threonylcarbamoyladenosine biosynthesis protein TsaB
MSLILSLETATRAGSIALTRDEVLLSAREGEAQDSQSIHLLEQIEGALDDAGVALQEIDLFAVATGPGSFTGLRIGLATVKSFATTLARPCIGIPTLHAVAHSAGASNCTVALLPAGRGELFAQRLAVSGAGAVKPLDAPTHQTPQSLLDRLAALRSLKWAGAGADIFAEAIKARALSEGIVFQAVHDRGATSSDEERWTLVGSSNPLAVSIGELALGHARSGDLSLPQDLQAIYVRPSDAELNERCLE